jgi:hypothetical protein
MATVAPWAEAQVHGPSRRPLAKLTWWGTASARPGRTLHMHGVRSPRRPRPAHAAWRACRCFTGDVTTTRFMACPPPRLKLHATTPTPQQRQPGRGPQWSSGGLVMAFGVEVDKWLQTWIEAPKLGSLAAQASHEH